MCRSIFKVTACPCTPSKVAANRLTAAACPPTPPRPQEALFEEMGVESDRAVGADFEGCRALAQPLKKARVVLAPRQ